MSRRRIRLVPNDCVEALEVRVALYFDVEGEAFVNVNWPEEVPKHEVLGVLRMAEDIVLNAE